MDTILPTSNDSPSQDPRFAAAIEAAARVNEPPRVDAAASDNATSNDGRQVDLELNELVTADFIVETFDGLQQSGVHLAAWLSKLELTDRHRALIPLDPGERKMIRPWANYAAAKLQEQLAEDPKLGVQVCMASVAIVLGKRILLLYALFREERDARESEARARLSPQPAPQPTPPQVS